MQPEQSSNDENQQNSISEAAADFKKNKKSLTSKNEKDNAKIKIVLAGVATLFTCGLALPCAAPVAIYQATKLCKDDKPKSMSMK